jgi:3-oxoacyl-[acyl-carrier-protein] synthase-3
VPATSLGPIDGIAILGGGTAFPDRELGNEDVLRRIAHVAWPGGVDAERLAFAAASLAETTGVARRAWAHEVGAPLDHAGETTTADLGAEAAVRALADARLDARDVTMLVCATSTPHRMTSTTSAAIGAKIGACAACMDVRTGCAAFLFALTTAALYVAAGSGPVLLVGTETFSKVVPPANKMAALALGDGAGAIVLGRGQGAIEGAYLATDGALGRLVTTDGALPPTEAEIARGGYVLSGEPDELLAVLPEKYDEAIGGALARARLDARAIDLFVPHQTSVPLIERVAARAGFADVFVNVARHANVGAAGTVVALVEARAEARLANGKRVLLASVGGGMSWGSVIVRV